MKSSQQPTIRRRTNGTIDIDHYRNAALSMRRSTSLGIARKSRPALRAMAAGAVLLTALGIIGACRQPEALTPRTAAMAPPPAIR